VRIKDVSHHDIFRHDAHCINQIATRLTRDGEIVAVFNEERFPFHHDSGRTLLARSADGVSFQAGCNLSVPGAETPAAYPSVIRGRDGAWRAVYSSNAKGRIRFVRFDSAWLEECFASKG